VQQGPQKYAERHSDLHTVKPVDGAVEDLLPECGVRRDMNEFAAIRHAGDGPTYMVRLHQQLRIAGGEPENTE
jgi:hypothetical protein